MRVSSAGVVCWSGVESRERQVISPSLVRPGSAEVLGTNHRREPGLTHTRTDSQHVRGPPPPRHRPTGIVVVRMRGETPSASSLGPWLCRVSSLSAHYRHVSGLQSHRDAQDTWLGGVWFVSLARLPALVSLWNRGIHVY